MYPFMIYIYMFNWSLVEGFQWDSGNGRKNAEKHGVDQSQAEQVFFSHPLLVIEDVRHSENEVRFHALGQTEDMRRLHITFTLRSKGRLIRIISARDMSRNERQIYDAAT